MRQDQKVPSERQTLQDTKITIGFRLRPHTHSTCTPSYAHAHSDTLPHLGWRSKIAASGVSIVQKWVDALLCPPQTTILSAQSPPLNNGAHPHDIPAHPLPSVRVIAVTLKRNCLEILCCLLLVYILKSLRKRSRSFLTLSMHHAYMFRRAHKSFL